MEVFDCEIVFKFAAVGVYRVVIVLPFSRLFELIEPGALVLGSCITSLDVIDMCRAVPASFTGFVVAHGVVTT